MLKVKTPCENNMVIYHADVKVPYKYKSLNNHVKLVIVKLHYLIMMVKIS